MDYTTLAAVKSEANMIETDATRDALLSSLITSVSRAIDRFCTGVTSSDSDNYFQTATLTNEVLGGWLRMDGSLSFYLHKPRIASVTALAYRTIMTGAWQDIDTTLVLANGSPAIVAYTYLPIRPMFVFGKITYSGGLGLTTADLPADLVEAATIWTIRFFREAQTGLTDQIGVADLGILLYTKAIPDRVRQMLTPYMRSQAWNQRG